MALNVVSSDRLSTNVSTTNLNTSFGQLGSRSVIINGAMQVAQRATTSASITTGGYYTVDRWYTTLATAGTWTQYQDADVPAGKGFGKSLSFDCTTADASLGAGDRAMLSYRLEGQDVQRFRKGTAGAKKFALSFRVKSPKTGTHIVELQDADNNRLISKAYTVSSSNTWEKKELTISKDTTGAFDNDNAKSLTIAWWLAAGSDYTSGTLATSWVTPTNANRVVGQVSCVDSTANNFYLTGVQLETTACTDFEHKSHGEDLARCQRYYFRQNLANNQFFGQGFAANDSFGDVMIHFPVPMRTKPTGLEQTGTAGDYKLARRTSSTTCSAVPTFSNSTETFGTLTSTTGSGMSGGEAVFLQSTGDDHYIGWTGAEL